MMKQAVFLRFFIAFCFSFLVFSCERRKPGEHVPDPQTFEPSGEQQDNTRTVEPDTDQNIAVPETPGIPSEKPKPMPTAEELKQITPSQEAKRELGNDAMKAAQMKPDEFVNYMKTRIPYYRGKGALKTENDMVRIQITENEMQIETVKGKQTFPMQ